MSYEHDYLQFPCLHKLTELTYLRLNVNAHERPDALTSLRKLRELSINKYASYQPLMISRAAKITKLVVRGSVVSCSHPTLKISLEYHSS